MALDTDTVRRIAKLARLHVEEDALAPLADELNNILGWVEQLDEVDTEATDGVGEVEIHTVLQWAHALTGIDRTLGST